MENSTPNDREITTTTIISKNEKQNKKRKKRKWKNKNVNQLLNIAVYLNRLGERDGIQVHFKL